MLKVYLRKMWFGPDGHRYKVNRNGDGTTDVPERFRDALPSNARIQGEDPAPTPVALEGVEPKSLKDYDTERAAAEDEARVHEEADAALEGDEADEADKKAAAAAVARRRRAK